MIQNMAKNRQGQHKGQSNKRLHAINLLNYNQLFTHHKSQKNNKLTPITTYNFRFPYFAKKKEERVIDSGGKDL